MASQVTWAVKLGEVGAMLVLSQVSLLRIVIRQDIVTSVIFFKLLLLVSRQCIVTSI